MNLRNPTHHSKRHQKPGRNPQKNAQKEVGTSSNLFINYLAYSTARFANNGYFNIAWVVHFYFNPVADITSDS